MFFQYEVNRVKSSIPLTKSYQSLNRGVLEHMFDVQNWQTSDLPPKWIFALNLQTLIMHSVKSISLPKLLKVTTD